MGADDGLTVLITNVRLDGRTGTETWVEAFALELQRQGHRPVVYTPRGGPIADALRAATIPVVHDPRDLAQAPDVIHGHHTNPTLTALLAWPGVPAVFLIHDWSAWHDVPVRFPRIRRIVPVDETCADRALEAGFADDEVQVVLNFVDVERHRPRGPLPSRPRRAVLLDNQATRENHGGVVAEACARAGLELDIVGAAAGTLTGRPEALLPGYDLVFAKAKAALDAMATGCAVVLVHEQGVGGLVTSERFDGLRALNFGRRTLTGPVTADTLGDAIVAYDPADAAVVSGRVRAEASVAQAATRFVALYRAVIAEQAAAGEDPDAERAALAGYLRQAEADFERVEHAGHLAQAYADADARLAEASARLAETSARLERAEEARREADELARGLAAELRAAHAAAADSEASAHAARVALAAVAGSARWRLVQRALAPLDRWRRRRGPR